MKESEEYEQLIRVEMIASKEDEVRNPYLKQGSKYSIIPVPKDKNDLIERFEKLYAQRWFESLQSNFLEKKCKGLNKEVFFVQELEELEKFISKSRSLNIFDAIDKNIQSNYYEFLRLENGYYNGNLLYQSNFEVFDYFNHDSDYVYAKYFLYKKWLENKLSIKSEEKVISQTNNVDIETGIEIGLLTYLSDNFCPPDERFTDLTKYNHIYFYLFPKKDDDNLDVKRALHKSYKTLIKKEFGFDYMSSQIKVNNPDTYRSQLNKIKFDYKENCK